MSIILGNNGSGQGIGARPSHNGIHALQVFAFAANHDDITGFKGFRRHGVEDHVAGNEKAGFQAEQIIDMTTDGFWESENASGEIYGKEKIYDLIRAHAGLSAKGILNICIDLPEAENLKMM